MPKICLSYSYLLIDKHLQDTDYSTNLNSFLVLYHHEMSLGMKLLLFHIRLNLQHLYFLILFPRLLSLNVNKIKLVIRVRFHYIQLCLGKQFHCIFHSLQLYTQDNKPNRSLQFYHNLVRIWQQSQHTLKLYLNLHSILSMKVLYDT